MTQARRSNLRILHFNDKTITLSEAFNVFADVQVYDITPSPSVGGAARFAAKVQELTAQEPALILFSGDAFNPSLLSTVTKGCHMVPVLNALGVHCAAVGNHDVDWGIPKLEELIGACHFPWLLANVLDRQSGGPLAHGVKPTHMLDWQGLKIGLVGLAEQDWITTLVTLSPESVSYLDFVEEGRRLALGLKADGADVVIALTHMRVPNDQLLAASVPEFDLVLGGHDHERWEESVEPHGVQLVKSGTDFRELSEIVLQLEHNGSRRKTSVKTHLITSDLPEHPEMRSIVEKSAGMLEARMGEVIGETAVPLDGRFSCVRSRESNLANLCCDALREACRADVALINSGTFRSDAIHPPGRLTMKDLLSILPMLEDTCVLRLSGRSLVQALENGLSAFPKLEGRFLQVSGIKFAFDSAKAAGHRIQESSVCIAGQPLVEDQQYTVVTKQYMHHGKDGFTSLQGAEVVMDSECCPMLPTLMRHVFMEINVLNNMQVHAQQVRKFGLRWLHHKSGNRAPKKEQHSSSRISVRDEESGRYMVAPCIDGRIVNQAQPQNASCIPA